MGDTGATNRLRELPSVGDLVDGVQASSSVERVWILKAARQVLDKQRAALIRGESSATRESVVSMTADLAAQLSLPRLRPVVNATGVVIHTNLGRAPMSEDVGRAVSDVAQGYSNLEFDLESGERGSRRDLVEDLLCEVTGAEAALAVNNNAAAVTLALAATCAGHEVIVSRGELVEIGGSFRVPEILEQSGASLVEVGTTNKTRVQDFEAAVRSATRGVLRVHQSNFRTVGFTEFPDDSDLVELTQRKGLTLIEDLGSGAVGRIGDEPSIRERLEAGVEVVCASADKLMGGPQAGLIVGKASVVELCARHPLARVVRIDKLQVAALDATLRRVVEHGGESVTALSMLNLTAEDLRLSALEIAEVVGPSATVEAGVSAAGGGSLPSTGFEGYVCCIDPSQVMSCDDLLAGLRRQEPPVIARIKGGRVIVDPRTLLPGQAGVVSSSVCRVLGLG